MKAKIQRDVEIFNKIILLMDTAKQSFMINFIKNHKDYLIKLLNKRVDEINYSDIVYIDECSYMVLKIIAK